MKNLLFIPAYIWLMFLIGCTKHIFTETVDVNAMLEEFPVMDLHGISNDISFIPLSGDSNLLLSGNSVLKYVGNNDIIIESERRLYRFDHNGSFLNAIGSIGQGPGEYTAPGRVSYDETNDRLYLFTNNILQQWDMDGEYLGNIEFPDKASLQSVIALNNDSILILRRNYHENGKLSQCIQWVSPGGKLMKSIDFACDSTIVNIVMRSYPEIYKVNNEVFIRNEWDSQLYRLNFENFQVEKTLDFGKYNSNRWLFQDASQREKIGNEIVKVESAILSENTIWLEFWLDNALHYMLIDRDGTLLHHSFTKSYIDNPVGLVFDESYAIYFWPSYVDNNGKLYSIIYPEDFDQEQLQQLSILTDTNVAADSNPILVQVTL